MKRIIAFIFIFYFYLDFSFFPNVFNSSLFFSYSIFGLLSLLIIQRSFKENIFWIILGSYFLNILMPLSWLLYIGTWLLLLIVIYNFKRIFFEEIVTTFKINILFGIIFVIYQSVILILNFLIDKINLFQLMNLVFWLNMFWRVLLLLFFFNLNLWLFKYITNKK